MNIEEPTHSVPQPPKYCRPHVLDNETGRDRGLSKEYLPAIVTTTLVGHGQQ